MGTRPWAVPLGSLLAASVALQACTVGPNYVRPTAPVPTTFKEASPGGAQWAPARPGDLADRGAWWRAFNDPLLDQLERRVEVDNQNLKAADAAYRAAVELISQSRAQAFPTAGLSTSGSAGQTGGVSRNSLGLSGSASWAPDLWGRIRRTVEGDRAAAQASAADLASARLSAQAALAGTYLQLRILDQQRTLLETTAANYRRSVTLAQNRYNVGVVARADVISAQTQLRQAEASALDIGVRRAQAEHAIATLVGVPPAALTIAPLAAASVVEPPEAPTGLPSTLLERRPDIAAAERRMAAANADIGVATAAYYPNFTLSADGGLAGSSLGNLFSVASSFWSLGAGLTQSAIDFGARRSRVRQARARYDQAVAQYRQTSLEAFQAVEDQLAALRILRQEAVARAETEALARRAEELALNQYRAGLVDFNAVITAQTQALSAAQSTLSVRNNRLQASVGLIEALGGGWTAADLPNPRGKISFP